ncbi:cytochrome P450 [Aspergillus bertholletiae]|uniref:Cytochrome P450 n=1 Tax=Aspergillus bertholletiae TaxID=1226010 RepID=A0A5N7B8V1_9EURO|nr:cytochrome P450 [Aspergillus bertholletiae]
MSCLPWLTLVVTLAILSVAMLVIYRRWLHPLASIPGPFLASITNWHDGWRFMRGGSQEYYLHLHREYGPVVRYGPNSVMINDPYFLPQIFHRRAEKTSFYANNPGLFGVQKYEDLLNAKHGLAAAFSMASIKTYEPQVDRYLRVLLDGLMDSQASISLDTWIGWFTYDVVGCILFGEPIGFLENRQDIHGLVAGTSQAFDTIDYLARVPKLSWFYRKTYLGRKLFQLSAEYQNGIHILQTILEGQYDRYRGAPNSVCGKSQTIFQRLIASKYADGSLLNAHDVKGEAMQTMMAGSATIASATNRLFNNLIQNPQVLSKLQHEVGQLRLTEAAHPITFEQAHALPYTNACIRESFRLTPTIPLFPRTAPLGGLTYNGIYVPEGTAVASSPWITMKSKFLYGDDAAVYRPERWLEASPETLKQWDRYEFHWGYGNRLCTGRHLSVMEIYKLTVELVARFDFWFASDGSKRARAISPYGNSDTYLGSSAGSPTAVKPKLGCVTDRYRKIVVNKWRIELSLIFTAGSANLGSEMSIKISVDGDSAPGYRRIGLIGRPGICHASQHALGYTVAASIDPSLS